jgi:hypothetical protein
MNQIFMKIKYQDIAAGMQSLPAIWSQQVSKRWIENLTRLVPSLIM